MCCKKTILGLYWKGILLIRSIFIANSIPKVFNDIMLYGINLFFRDRINGVESICYLIFNNQSRRLINSIINKFKNILFGQVKKK